MFRTGSRLFCLIWVCEGDGSCQFWVEQTLAMAIAKIVYVNLCTAVAGAVFAGQSTDKCRRVAHYK
jgi:hypothetical protein